MYRQCFRLGTGTRTMIIKTYETCIDLDRIGECQNVPKNISGVLLYKIVSQARRRLIQPTGSVIAFREII
jgi:hypothetical protein